MAAARNLMQTIYLKGFETWLHEHKSPTNAKRILRCIAKLRSGEGLRYTTWPPRARFQFAVSFATPLDYFEAALQVRIPLLEELHGLDPSNGWSIRHPMAALYKYHTHLFCSKPPQYDTRGTKSEDHDTHPDEHLYQNSHMEVVI